MIVSKTGAATLIGWRKVHISSIWFQVEIFWWGGCIRDEVSIWWHWKRKSYFYKLSNRYNLSERLIDPVKHSQENSSHVFGIKVACSTYTTQHIVVENKLILWKPVLEQCKYKDISDSLTLITILGQYIEPLWIVPKKIF